MTAATFENDVEFAESDTSALGATVLLLLPDGVNSVTATRHGANEALRMFDEGFGDKRTDTFEIRNSLFTALQAPLLKYNDIVTEVVGESRIQWQIKDVQKPDSIVTRYAAVQSW